MGYRFEELPWILLLTDFTKSVARFSTNPHLQLSSNATSPSRIGGYNLLSRTPMPSPAESWHGGPT